jgi:predicted amidohydrolase
LKIKIAALQLQAYNLEQSEIALKRALEMVDIAAQTYQPDLIVTPECTYPAYVLGSSKEFNAAYKTDPVPLFAEKAKKYHCHIVVGVATPAISADGNAIIYNEAVLIGADGEVIGRSAKRMLWHFDSKWFCPGSDYPVFETAIGRIGLLVCADGRVPEIARCLALNGAQILVDPTAWVANAFKRENLNNIQGDVMLATRAYENGVICVAADKIGLERDTVLYAGMSCLIDPSGHKVAQGSSHQEEVVFGEVELPTKAFPAVARRPELYGALVKPVENLIIHELLKQPIVPAKSVLRAAVVQHVSFNSTELMGEVVRGFINQLSREGVDLAVMPDIAAGFAEELAHKGDLVFPFYRSLSKLSGVALLVPAIEIEGSRRYKTAKLFHNGQEIGEWRQSHFTPQDEGNWTPGNNMGLVVELPGGSGARVGVMLGADGYVPEVARTLMLNGADLLLWATRANVAGAGKGFEVAAIARSRAAENRLYVLVATPFEARSGISVYDGARYGRSLIADPNGTVVAPCLPDTAMAVGTQISVASSREKLRAPGTDVVYNRRPDTYHVLIQP